MAKTHKLASTEECLGITNTTRTELHGQVVTVKVHVVRNKIPHHHRSKRLDTRATNHNVLIG